MKTQFNISKLLETGQIQNELDFERALIAERKLGVLSKEDTKYKSVRKKLRGIIEAYENKHWSTNNEVSDEEIEQSKIAENIAEKERIFVKKRKQLIRNKLKQLNLTQQNLGEILGHKSKSYMSELMNGVNPFSLKDLIVIHRLLKLNLTELIPTFLTQAENEKIIESIQKLDNPKLSMSKKDFERV